MRTNKLSLFICFLVAITCSHCTKLDETLYDRVNEATFLQSKEDVIRTFLKPYDQAYYSVQANTFQMQEDPADLFMTPNRQGRWLDGGTYYRLHYHTWTPQDAYITGAWNDLYLGIVQANNSIEVLQGLDLKKFSVTEREQREFIAELRTMRAWLYLRLFDLFRNIEIVTKYKGESVAVGQATPQQTFAFIETEIKESLPDLYSKGEAGTEKFAGRWTRASAMAILVRLYLNAQVYIGQPKYQECKTAAEEIIAGKYGSYAIDNRWDGPFDFNNDQSRETIFAFASSFAYSHYHYEALARSNAVYWWMTPFRAAPYFSFSDRIDTNPKYALQPGKDVDGKEYTFQLGKPFVKFQQYPDDIRLNVYKNLGSSKREGMFLYGYLTYNSNKDTVTSSTGYTLYIRDQVGIFYQNVNGKLITLGPGQVPADKKSDMTYADQNSGVYMIKYPLYPSNDNNKWEADFAEIRLAEIYYSLAECKFREGDKAAASKLLNDVRSRYYPAGSSSLYKPDGSQLTEQELLDEWGREFLGEGRRRTDLIRFGKFNSGIWWDKQPDADNHTSIFPIGQNILNISPQLKQNPGY